MDRYGFDDIDDALDEEYEARILLRYCLTGDEALAVLRGDPPTEVIRRRDAARSG